MCVLFIGTTHITMGVGLTLLCEGLNGFWWCESLDSLPPFSIWITDKVSRWLVVSRVRLAWQVYFYQHSKLDLFHQVHFGTLILCIQI